MFRFTIRDVLWLMVAVAVGTQSSPAGSDSLEEAASAGPAADIAEYSSQLFLRVKSPLRQRLFGEGVALTLLGVYKNEKSPDFSGL
jgi:hypothetical protein